MNQALIDSFTELVNKCACDNEHIKKILLQQDRILTQQEKTMND